MYFDSFNICDIYTKNIVFTNNLLEPNKFNESVFMSNFRTMEHDKAIMILHA